MILFTVWSLDELTWKSPIDHPPFTRDHWKFCTLFCSSLRFWSPQPHLRHSLLTPPRCCSWGLYHLLLISMNASVCYLKYVLKMRKCCLRNHMKTNEGEATLNVLLMLKQAFWYSWSSLIGLGYLQAGLQKLKGGRAELIFLHRGHGLSPPQIPKQTCLRLRRFNPRICSGSLLPDPQSISHEKWFLWDLVPKMDQETTYQHTALCIQPA